MSKLDSATVIYDTRPADFSANRWLDALVCGSGKVGAAITGATASEAILINHASLREGGKTQALQDISDKFGQIRKLYSDAKVLEAEALLSSEFKKKGYNPEVDYQIPLCQINLNFAQEGFPTEYKRILDMEGAEAQVSFKTAQTLHERNMFVSRANDMVVFSATKNGAGKINLVVSAKTIAGTHSDVTTSPVASVRYEGNWLYFNGKTLTGLEYGLVARVVVDKGLVATRADGIVVDSADGVLILAKPFVGGNSTGEFTKIKKEIELIKQTYAKLHSQSEAMHKRLWNRVTLDLGNKTALTQSALMHKAHEGRLSSTLLNRLWNFAKYLSICCEGLALLSPEGLWLGERRSKDFSMFNNTAQLLLGGLSLSTSPDSVLELLTHFEKYSDDLRKNSSRIFGATGYFVPDKISPGSALAGSAHPSTLHFVASSALSANLFYSYYLATGDVKTLKSRIFPFMKQVLEFYSDFLKLDNNGVYSTMPSYSPEITPGNTVQGKRLENFFFATNSTVDFLAIGALLDNLIHASEVLADTKNVSLWQEMRGKVPKLQANEDGGLREFTNSAFMDGKNARGNLHLYGLYPLKTLSFNDYEVLYQPKITTEQNPIISLRDASVNSIHNRLRTAGVAQNTRTLAMYAPQIAHNRTSSEATHDVMLKLISSAFTNSGLSLSNDWRGGGFSHSSTPTLDITGNFGLASAITECLVQSNARTLRVLPSVFSELSIGELTDLSTDFGAKINMLWDVTRGKLTLKIMPKITTTIDILFPPNFKKPKNANLKLEKDQTLRNIALTAGKAWSIEF